MRSSRSRTSRSCRRRRSWSRLSRRCCRKAPRLRGLRGLTRARRGWLAPRGVGLAPAEQRRAPARGPYGYVPWHTRLDSYRRSSDPLVAATAAARTLKSSEDREQAASKSRQTHGCPPRP
jgi:hypothetical protein